MTPTIAPYTETSRTLLQQGKTDYANGNYQRAIACFNQVLQIDSGNFWAMLYRGEAYRQTQQYTAAQADFDTVLAQQPQHSWTLAHRGMVFKALNMLQNALLDLTMAIDHQPTYAWAIAQRGNIYTALGRYEDALADMDRIMILNPSLVSPWEGERGLLLNALGRYQETIACCQPKVQQDKTDFITHYSLVVAQTLLSAACSQANATKLEAHLHSLLSQSPPLNPQQKAAVRYRLGGLAALQNNFQLAQSHLQDAILLDDEPQEMVRHDPAWKQFRLEQR
ncbi:MAG: tetratricopeptide repeat protein [Chloroflexota bacterium]